MSRSPAVARFRRALMVLLVILPSPAGAQVPRPSEVANAEPQAAPPARMPGQLRGAPQSPGSARGGYDEYRSARWIEFVALLTVLGALGFRHGVLPALAVRGVPTADAGDRARRLGMSALLLYAFAIVVRVYNESVTVHGAQHALDPAQLMRLVTGTLWGAGWLLGACGAVLVGIGWGMSRRRVAVGTPFALTGAMGMVLSPALSGHAAASDHFVASVVLDVTHVTAAGLWLGGLLMVLVAGVPAMRRLNGGNTDAAVSALVSSFHPLALFCAPLVVAAGVGTAWLRLNGISDLWHTDYGLMLLRKTVLVLCVLAMGAYNALRVRRRLGAGDATRRFRWTGAIELLFAAGVIALTTWLVTMPPPAFGAVP